MKHFKNDGLKKKVDINATTLKDVFFIDNPHENRVPRRSERERYYQEDLVASAVPFQPDMTADEIKDIISKTVPRFNGMTPPFHFLKAVGDTLIKPNIKNWDLKIIKHQTGQGPLYVRATSKIDWNFFPKYDSSEGTDTEDEDLAQLSTGSELEAEEWEKNPPKKRKKVHFTNASSASNVCAGKIPSSTKRGDSFCAEETINNTPEGSQSLVTCPICNKVFLSSVVEGHTSMCGANPESHLYDDLMFEVVPPVPLSGNLDEVPSAETDRAHASNTEHS